MVIVYADASVLVSMILEDGNSGRVKSLVRDFEGKMVWTDFLKLEVFNAIHMGVGEKRQSEQDAEVSLRLARDLVASGRLRKHELEWARVFGRAQGLSDSHTSAIKVRSLDILHVASAMELGVREFWSFDKRQRLLAREVGLRVND